MKHARKDYATRTIENTEVCPCGNTFVEDDDYDSAGSESGVCCPDCGNEKFKTVKELIKQQPTAGEWTKACRGMVEGIDRAIHPKSIPYESTRDRLIEACDRLDKAEAENKELLELCEEFMEIADDGSARFDDPEPGSIYLRAEAVITRAKKEG